MATRHSKTFIEKFKPIVPTDSVSDEDYFFPSELPETFDPQFLWTLVDPNVDSGQQYWLPGFHYVNRIGHVFTEKPWADSDLADEYRRF